MEEVKGAPVDDSLSAPDNEETYTETPDTFSVAGAHARLQRDNEAMAKLILVDLPGVSMVDREREQLAWMQSNTAISSSMGTPAPYGTTRMIGITETYAVCFEMLENEKPASDEEMRVIAEREQLYYELRLKRITTQLQATLLIRECNSRLKRFSASAEPLQAIITRASKLREMLQRATDLQELAEHPDAVAAANAALTRVTTQRAGSVRPLSMAFELKDPTTYAERKSKKKRKNKKQLPAAAPQQPPTVSVLKRRIRLALIKSGAWPDDDANRRSIVCLANAKVHVEGTRMVVVEQNPSLTAPVPFLITRIRVYNMFDLRKPVYDHSVLDPNSQLGRVIGACVRGDEFAVVYAQHVLYSQVSSGAAYLAIKFDKPILTCVGFHENHIVVGANHGAIYYYTTDTGAPDGYTDLPWEMPVLGCRAQGPCLLAWDHRNTYRYHVFPDLVPPYEFYTSRPMGVTGCGSLMFLLNETGNLWISDTLTQGAMRQINPPAAISGRYIVENNGDIVNIPHDKPDVEDDFFRLYEQVTYDYHAVYCDRRSVNVLYPDGTFRRLELKK